MHKTIYIRKVTVKQVLKIVISRRDIIIMHKVIYNYVHGRPTIRGSSHNYDVHVCLCGAH